MKFDLDWKGLLMAVLRAAVPFFSGALGGLLSGCSVYGTGIGATL